MDIFFYVGSWSLVIVGILYIIADKTDFKMGKYENGVYNAQYEIHIYVVNIGAVTILKEDGRAQALAIAAEYWDLEDVYKVKVWDLRKGPIEPNNPTAPGLIKEYI